MIYYFVTHDGEIETEDNAPGWYSKEVNPNMFTVKRLAVAEARKNAKARIAELEQRLEELK